MSNAIWTVAEISERRQWDYMYAIQTINLTKIYHPPRGMMRLIVKSPLKTEVVAVDKVNLTVQKGKLFGLIGPNGAGKTTLIKLLCTLLWPTSGRALVNGYDTMREEEKVKASVGFASGEERSFYWRLTGRENLQFFAALHNLSGKRAEKCIVQVLRQVGLEEAADNMFYSYSGGMKQKLAIARALLTNPAILFLDEPTKSVDAVTAQALRQFIREKLVKEEGRTVFLTSHRLEEVEELCDRIAIMNRGKITYCGTVKELKDILQPQKHYVLEIKDILKEKLVDITSYRDVTNVFIDGQEGNGCLKLEFASANGSSPLSRVLRNILDEGGMIISCQSQEPKLEEMFIEHLQEVSRM